MLISILVTDVYLSTVHRGGEGVCLSACWDTTPLEQTPPRSRHPPEQAPLEQTPPRADTPQEQTPLREQTPPLEQTPPRADTPRADTPPEQTPPGADTRPEHMATAADGTHPNGMHSCLFFILIRLEYLSSVIDRFLCFAGFFCIKTFTSQHWCFC